MAPPAQPAAPAPGPPLPAGIKPYPEGAGVEAILKAFLGVPFRVDGVVTDDGRWATWNKQETTLKSPGFNCSGYLLEAVRHLTGRDVTIAQAIRDRDGDSGPDSELGLDWDYGLDILLNLSGAELAELIPAPQNGKLRTNGSGRPEGLGVDINGPGFPDLIAGLDPGTVYLFAISKPDRRFKGGLSYYHVGVIYADGASNVWLYHDTARAGAHRLNINSPSGVASIRRYFPPVRSSERRIVLARLNPGRLPPPAPRATVAQPQDAPAGGRPASPPPPVAAKADPALAKAGPQAPPAAEPPAETVSPYALGPADAIDPGLWLDDKVDPWTAAARLASGSSPIEGVGDGLGGEAETLFDFVPSELGAPSQAAPPAGSPAPDGRFLVRAISQPTVGATGRKPGPDSPPTPTDRAKKVGLDLGLAQPAAPGPAQTATPAEPAVPGPAVISPSVDHASLPPGEDLGNGVKVFTLIK
ncbi:MAG: hypothetical protein LBF58_07055 [Deltaproteobacteria bacterium]|nr:hypothetical protein [Deltaproteobacteria bacterium]